MVTALCYGFSSPWDNGIAMQGVAFVNSFLSILRGFILKCRTSYLNILPYICYCFNNTQTHIHTRRLALTRTHTHNTGNENSVPRTKFHYLLITSNDISFLHRFWTIALPFFFWIPHYSIAAKIYVNYSQPFENLWTLNIYFRVPNIVLFLQDCLPSTCRTRNGDSRPYCSDKRERPDTWQSIQDKWKHETVNIIFAC